MSPNATRKLLAVHRWCGLIVSLNFIVLALTGLILVFHDEIDAALGVVPKVADQGEVISYARAVEIAKATNPKANAVYVFHKDEDYPGIVFVGLAEGSRGFRDAKPVAIARNGGRIMEKLDLEGSFTATILKLHAQLFLGLPGQLFLGVVSLVVLTSLVTGAIVYGPTMRRFTFGLLRRDRSLRTLLADVHKLLGLCVLGWNFVVASTGFLLSVGTFLLQFYSMTELAAMGVPYAGEPMVTDLSTLDAAAVAAERAIPGRGWVTVALPGSDFASPRHYTVLLEGGKGIESHMRSLAMVDARDPERVQPKELPWYLKALLLSEPLHFGNYGGLPLKILWSLFTVMTLGLSGTGVWVFFSGRKKRAVAPLPEIEGGIVA